MQCQEMAYCLGKKLNLPTINIDLAIVEALQTTSCSAQNVILSAVNELFDISKKCKETSDDEEVAEGTNTYTYWDVSVHFGSDAALTDSQTVGLTDGDGGIM